MTEKNFLSIIDKKGLYENDRKTYGEWNGYSFAMKRTMHFKTRMDRRNRRGNFYDSYKNIYQVRFYSTGILPNEAKEYFMQVCRKVDGEFFVSPSGMINVYFLHEGGFSYIKHDTDESVNISETILEALTLTMIKTMVPMQEAKRNIKLLVPIMENSSSSEI